MKVFDLPAPILGDRSFDASADGPARLRNFIAPIANCTSLIWKGTNASRYPYPVESGARHRAVDRYFAECKTARSVNEPAIRGEPDTAAQRS